MPPLEPIPEQLSEASLERRRQQRCRVQGEFLRGPIPLPWLEQAARLPGKALAVALALWFRAGVTSSRSDLRVSGKLLERFGVGRKAGYCALRSLEDAGLICVLRAPGRCPVVELLDSKSSD
jgi:hypothetical protein